MDPFDRTFLPAAAAAGLPMASISRQIPIFRRCVGLGQAVLLLTRCTRPDRPLSGDHLLMLTRERLVVTAESRLLHHARLHLDAAISELGEITWRPDERQTSMELDATALDGVRERFLIRARRPNSLWTIDTALGFVFQRTSTTGQRRFSPVGPIATRPLIRLAT